MLKSQSVVLFDVRFPQKVDILGCHCKTCNGFRIPQKPPYSMISSLGKVERNVMVESLATSGLERDRSMCC